MARRTGAAFVRRLIVSLLRQEETLKHSAEGETRASSPLDANYLLKVLATAEINA